MRASQLKDRNGDIRAVYKVCEGKEQFPPLLSAQNQGEAENNASTAMGSVGSDSFH